MLGGDGVERMTLLSRSFHSSCGGAGNFSLLRAKKSHQKKARGSAPHVLLTACGKAAQVPITYSSRERTGLKAASSASSQSYCLYRRDHLPEREFGAPVWWIGRVRAFAYFHGVKPGAPRSAFLSW